MTKDERIKELEAALAAVLVSGIEHGHPRVGYLNVQIDRVVWEHAQRVLVKRGEDYDFDKDFDDHPADWNDE